ncbi:MAG TPA: hypothetical protein VK464_03050 [Symbiobacteriaceae bacterium]|nr:hypothetical protein [Symbiobacteriaceae bacterium]
MLPDKTSPAPAPEEQEPEQRGAIRTLWLGILFSLAFTGLIYLAGGRLEAIPKLPDQGASWYYWKLPAPTFWTHLTAWGFYLAHQVTNWALIWYAQTRRPRYTNGLHKVNLWALATNAFFVLLHFAQSHIWYDGLAQDVSIWSSQASVAILLVLVLIMENPRRGLFFGYKAPLRQQVVQAVRRYHGYFFSWAILYTFWYHPMERTQGHLIGFFYMFLLMLQGSLFFTRVHTDRWWMLTQEVTVLIHGMLVALQQGAGLWPMFTFGFGGIFVITQMHGLGWSRWTRGAVLAAYIGLVTWTYSLRGWQRIDEVVRIPLIDYVAVFCFAGLIGLALRVFSRQTGD